MSLADAKQAVRAAVMAGGFSYTQAAALTAALEELLEAFAAEKLAAVEASLAAAAQPPSSGQ